LGVRCCVSTALPGTGGGNGSEGNRDRVGTRGYARVNQFNSQPRGRNKERDWEQVGGAGDGDGRAGNTPRNTPAPSQVKDGRRDWNRAQDGVKSIRSQTPSPRMGQGMGERKVNEGTPEGRHTGPNGAPASSKSSPV
ncbi:unnamed protein product, partial [Discosporangium mesarthrocarpum]